MIHRNYLVLSFFIRRYTASIVHRTVENCVKFILKHAKNIRRQIANSLATISYVLLVMCNGRQLAVDKHFILRMQAGNTLEWVYASLCTSFSLRSIFVWEIWFWCEQEPKLPQKYKRKPNENQSNGKNQTETVSYLRRRKNLCFFSQLKMKKKWEKQNIVYKARRNGNKFKPKLMQETTLWQK